MLQKLGASQVMLAGAEIYQALQLKTIDGRSSTATPATGHGLREVTKFNIGPGWHQPSSLCGLMIHKDAWAKLPEEFKHIIDVAAKANVAYMSSWYEWTIPRHREFRKKGTQVFKSQFRPEILEGILGIPAG